MSNLSPPPERTVDSQAFLSDSMHITDIKERHNYTPNVAHAAWLTLRIMHDRVHVPSNTPPREAQALRNARRNLFGHMQKSSSQERAVAAVYYAVRHLDPADGGGIVTIVELLVGLPPRSCSIKRIADLETCFQVETQCSPVLVGSSHPVHSLPLEALAGTERTVVPLYHNLVTRQSCFKDMSNYRQQRVLMMLSVAFYTDLPFLFRREPFRLCVACLLAGSGLWGDCTAAQADGYFNYIGIAANRRSGAVEIFRHLTRFIHRGSDDDDEQSLGSLDLEGWQPVRPAKSARPPVDAPSRSQSCPPH